MVIEESIVGARLLNRITSQSLICNAPFFVELIFGRRIVRMLILLRHIVRGLILRERIVKVQILRRRIVRGLNLIPHIAREQVL